MNGVVGEHAFDVDMVAADADIGKFHQLCCAAHDGSTEFLGALSGFWVYTSHKGDAHRHVDIAHHLTVQQRI